MLCSFVPRTILTQKKKKCKQPVCDFQGVRDTGPTCRRCWYHPLNFDTSCKQPSVFSLMLNSA